MRIELMLPTYHAGVLPLNYGGKEPLQGNDP